MSPACRDGKGWKGGRWGPTGSPPSPGRPLLSAVPGPPSGGAPHAALCPGPVTGPWVQPRAGGGRPRSPAPEVGAQPCPPAAPACAAPSVGVRRLPAALGGPPPAPAWVGCGVRRPTQLRALQGRPCVCRCRLRPETVNAASCRGSGGRAAAAVPPAALHSLLSCLLPPQLCSSQHSPRPGRQPLLGPWTLPACARRCCCGGPRLQAPLGSPGRTLWLSLVRPRGKRLQAAPGPRPDFPAWLSVAREGHGVVAQAARGQLIPGGPCCLRPHLLLFPWLR